ncbi:MAG: MFS transporter [Eubacteriales bacterium]|nr:MFS transporter [Eubacteriales bacterium]
MNRNTVQTIFIISLVYSAAYALTLSKGIFYNELLQGFYVSNFQFGQLFSVLGLCSMGAYLCSAWFATHFSPRTIVLGSLVINTAVPAILSTIPPYGIMLLCFGVMGFTNGIFYPTSVSVLRLSVPLTKQGQAFGLNYIFISLTGMLITIIGYIAILFGRTSENKIQILLILFAVSNAVSLLLAFLKIHPDPVENASTPHNLHATLLQLIRNPKVWAVIFIVFVNYIDYSTLNYTQPYLSNEFGLPPLVENLITLVRMYFIVGLAAPLAGTITDRYRSSVILIRAVFLLYSVATLATALHAQISTALVVLLILIMCLTANMAKSMSLITISEIGLDQYAITIALCMISFLSFSPDAFYYSICGWILDQFPSSGYQYIFSFTAILTLIGFLVCSWLHRQGAKRSF